MFEWQGRIMFRLAAEEIVFFLICHKCLGISKREVYEYAVEVLLMNGSLLFVDFLLSLFFHQLWFFFVFFVFFVPLRMCLGGLHFKHAGTCMIASVLFYVILMLSHAQLYERYADIEMAGMVLLSAACLLQKPLPAKISGLENNHKKIANVIIWLETLLIVVLWNFEVMGVSAMLVLHMGAMALFLFGKLKWKFDGTES